MLSGACSSADSPSGRSNPSGLAHIHGMGLDSDGVLYAGTHYGVYRLARERNPELVGDVVHDFMGFTVVGPNHFMGSGHPGADSDDTPPNLGLIESTDGGQTWHSLSMTGEADFHSLDYRHGLVFGLDSGTRSVMVTADKKTWYRRAEISAVDIAVSPTDPNGVLATTGTGLLRSVDQAKTFTPVADTPPLILLSWPDEGPLIGITPTGMVYASQDAGTTWQARRDLGERPQAVEAAGRGLVFVATDRGIHRSTDNGTTFEAFYTFDA
ncbi:F510_1955 family glycosylhydrolase [Mycolicibacterium sp. GF69]|uniref:F510_1955 family glycosylhydrolase n=1 Tax=Mycolicibacterium sp. GF69 TaxID=2267251 RepID=UPI00352BBA9D